MIEPNRKRSLSCVEDSANEDRTKHVLDLVQGWPENEMRERKDVFFRALTPFPAKSLHPGLPGALPVFRILYQYDKAA